MTIKTPPLLSLVPGRARKCWHLSFFVGVKSLEGVLKLNICGYSITDVGILTRLPNVEVLSLSVNSISSLQDFSSCVNLKELYLRKNQVASLDEVEHLKGLSSLRVLWLNDNPCASDPSYRQRVLSLLPGLVKLDGQDVSSPATPASPVVSPSSAAIKQRARDLSPSGGRDASGLNGVVPDGGKSMNVLYAVMALLRELDEEGLRVVRSECDSRLGMGLLP